MIDESNECGQLTMSPVSARGRRVTVLPSTSRFVPIEPSTNSLQQGQGYYQLRVFTKLQSHHDSQWVNLLATAFISVNAYFAQSISLEIRFASFSLCGAFHRVVQRRSEADSGAGSRKVVHRSRELEKCLLLRLPLPAPWALLLVDVLENMFCPLFDLVAALPLLSPRSHTRLLKARDCKRAKKILRFLKTAFDKEQFFIKWFFLLQFECLSLVIYYETGGWNAIFRGAPSPATFPWSQVMSSECQLPAASLYRWNIQQEIGWNVKFWPLCPPCAGLDCRVNYSELPSAFS